MTITDQFMSLIRAYNVVAKVRQKRKEIKKLMNWDSRK
jgi:hypothetical protein